VTPKRFQAYGLTIESDFALPELTPAGDSTSAVDVRIMLGTVPDHLETVVGRGVLYEASADEFLLNMPKIARYWVRNGNEILIEKAASASDNDVRVFMLGSCVGALLHQREMLVLHAAAIGTDAGAVLFAGPSGVGKSTLLGEMLNRGYSMMVDDVCGVVSAGLSGVEIVPGYPRTRLWADAAKRLEVDTSGLDRTRTSLEKFERQLPGAFWNRPAPMRRLYVLSMGNSDELSIEPLARVQAFGMVLFNTYRRQFLEGLEMQAPHFALASSVAATVRVARVRRPSGSFELGALADLIEADLAENVVSS
jgi:hypothetical protein